MDDLPHTKKSLGQHWLTDGKTLSAIADTAELDDDVVLEIGPGAGTLTRVLCQRAKQVIAVEFDKTLADDLPLAVGAKNLTVVHQDILQFDLTSLPPGYKVVANIPYYLTSNLIRGLSETPNPPRSAVLLVQKEVAERVAAKPGAMSLLSVTTQYYWEVSLGTKVPAKLFTPPPKVDSQILVLHRRRQALFAGTDARAFFRVVKAGFSNRRKTLLNSLSGGLRLSKPAAAAVLARAHLSPTARPQELTLAEWQQLYQAVRNGGVNT